jgi:outer membrane phospholipase A
MLFAALLLTLFQDAAKLSLSLTPPTTAVKTGETVPVGVYMRNTGGKPLDLTPPAKIDAKLASGTSVQPVELVRRGDAGPKGSLAPGETRFVEYALALPPNMTGRAVLQLDRLSAPAVVIEIDTAKAEAAKAEAAKAEAVKAEAARAEAARAAEAKPATEPPSQPAAQQSGQQDAQAGTQSGVPAGELPSEPPRQIAEHAPQRFSPHEPTYFVAGDRPSTRFQFSFKYQFIDPESPFGVDHPWLSSLHLGYTQTSLWDIAASSQPFTDSTYRPELFFSRDRLEGVHLPFVEQFGLQTGFQHESNGRDGDDSRGLNSLYVQPILFFGDKDAFSWRVMPKIYAYIGDKAGNADITDYRGYVDLRVVGGWIHGFEMSALGRLGKDFDRGSLQLDATYPLSALGKGTFDLYLQGQYFVGYGESLLDYNEYSESLRFGIALSR